MAGTYPAAGTTHVGPLDDGAMLRAASTDGIREAEKATGDLLTDGTLMRRAAAGVASVVAQIVREQRSERVVVLVGPGNNGGDALFAARDLKCDYGVIADVVLVADGAHEDGLAAARAVGLRILQHPQEEHDECGGPYCDGPESLRTVAAADLVVDGIVGIGARLSDATPWDSVLKNIPSEATVVAVDCPTPGVQADRTVTFGALKTAMLLDPAAVGDVDIVDIGIEPLDAPDAVRLGLRQLAQTWPVPGRADHKYTRGVVGFATGSDAFVGAAVLGVVAAVTAGPGMVRYVGPQRASDAVTAAAPEAVHGSGRVQAWVVGSGIDGPTERKANSERYRSAMAALTEDVPVVIDAGALAWLDEAMRPDGSVTVITPHAGELAAVLNTLGVRADTAQRASDAADRGARTRAQPDGAVTRQMIEADPVRWARAAADASGFIVLLKGGTTVIAAPPDRRRRRLHDSERPPVLVENRAPAWLATAGTGDVLAGLLGVALAAGIPAQFACAVAAYLHGRSAELANPGGPVRALDVATQLGRSVANLLRDGRDGSG